MRRLCSLLCFSAFLACGPRNVGEAENRHDVQWLADNPSSDSVAALGRLADTEEKARTALDARATKGDVNAFLAAWNAVTRNSEWGTAFLRTSLADPTRCESAATALPRKDLRLVPFINDIEGALARLAAGRRGAVVLASVLASLGVPAHAAIERRLVDAKTRGAMCEGIGAPEASGDAKSALLAVPPEGRDHSACVSAVIDVAATENVVVEWLATSAEPGLLSVAAKSTLPCPRIAAIWSKALAERPVEDQGALTVPLKSSIARCGTALDPVLGELLQKSSRARSTIVQAIDPFGTDLPAMKQTCNALRAGAVRNENRMIRERAEDALARGCAF